MKMRTPGDSYDYNAKDGEREACAVSMSWEVVGDSGNKGSVKTRILRQLKPIEIPRLNQAGRYHL